MPHQRSMGEQAAKGLFAFSELRQRTIVARIKRLEARVRAAAARTPLRRMEDAAGGDGAGERAGGDGAAAGPGVPANVSGEFRSAGVSPVCGPEARVPAPLAWPGLAGLAAAVVESHISVR